MNTRISLPPLDLVDKAINNPVIALDIWQNHFHKYAIFYANYERSRKTMPEDAEAMARDKYCSKISELKDPRALVNYTIKIIQDTYNKIHINERKESQRYVSFEDAEMEFISHDKNPEELLLDREAKINQKKVFHISKEKIKKLKPSHKDVLTLMYLENKTVAETAIILDINEGTVYKRAASALSELFKLLHSELINNPYFEKIVRSGFGEEGIKTLKGK